MKARIMKWRSWPTGQDFPVFFLEVTEKELQMYDAVVQLAKACKGIRGDAYQNNLVGVQEDALRKKRYLSIDIGTLLNLVAAIQDNEVKKSFAIGWLQSLADKINQPVGSLRTIVSCICGAQFSAKSPKKAEKMKASHIKKCQVIKERMKLFRRAKKTKDSLKGQRDGKVKSKGKRVEDSKGKGIRKKGAVRSKRKSKV